ncbi:MAG: lytic murein transglycosylase [Alphaproteobacteria bacterium]|nr:lytic murein transglycosylase [Alphaproteobacteria bacterium]
MWKRSLRRSLGLIGLAALAAAVLTGPADAAARCKNTGSFERWLEDFKREALSSGISRQTIAASLDGVTFDPAIIRRDSGQGVFTQGFLQFANRMTGGARHPNGMKNIKANAALFSRIEKEFGVPPAVVAALWGLESDYGAYKGGKYNIIRAVATLAYDCRRSEFFRKQLMDSLRIVQRGDLRPDEMIGNWAGELGPTQFTPSDYFKHGVDFDGDGRVDMIRSVPDALASAANLLKSFGWQRGQPWLQEVRVPAQMPWQEAGLDIQHPRSQWVRWGVRGAHSNLPSDNMPASLLLPMGRNGPAFLAYPNFKAYTEWNAAFVYATTAAYFATRLAGAPVVGKGNAEVVVPDAKQVQELQRLLGHRGYYKGEADGRMGALTRAAVKQAQIKLGLPADSYPTPELTERLRGGR